jgi:molybdate transport system substrate-binding protein
MKYVSLVIGIWMLALAIPPVAVAQAEVTLIAPGGARGAFEQLLPEFERDTNSKVNRVYTSGTAATQKVAKGEAFDVAVLQSPFQEALDSGKVAGAGTKLASISLAVAVRKGSSKPDISTIEALRKSLLEARSISCPDSSGGSAAGISCAEALKSLGISDQVQAKLKLTQGGPASMTLVAKGEAEIGLTYLSEIKDPAVDAVGTVLPELTAPRDLVAFVSSHTKSSAAVRALIDYLSSPKARSTYKNEGMDPAS